MSNAPSLNRQYFDNNGAVLAGGKLKFFEEGTSTPANVYDDAALTSAAGTELTLDSAGRVQRYFMDPDQGYKVELWDSGETTKYIEEDNVDALETSASTFATRLKQGFASPYDFGAAGGGAADESTEVQAAIDAQNTRGGGTVDLMGDTFRCDSTITLYSDIRLINGTLDFTNSTSLNFIDIVGTLATQVNLSSNASAGDTSISVDSVSGAGSQSWIFLTDTSGWGSGGSAIGEWVEVESASGTTIELSSKLIDAYTTANTGGYRLLTPVENVVLEDLRILADVSSTNTSAIRIENCQDVSVRNCVIDKARSAGITLRYSVDVDIQGCKFPSNDSPVVSQVGVFVDTACRGLRIDSCRFYRHADGIDMTPLTGVSRDNRITNCYFSGCVDGVQILENVQYTNISGCVFESLDTGVSRGIYIKCSHVNISHCDFRGLDTADVYLDYNVSGPSNASVHVSNCTASDGNSFFYLAGTTPTVVGLSLSGNVVHGYTSGPVIYLTGVSCEHVHIHNNTIDMNDSSLDGIRVEMPSTSVNDLSISGNQVINIGAGSSTWGIVVSTSGNGSCDDVKIKNNTIEFSGNTTLSNGIFLEFGSRADVSGNSVRTSGTVSLQGILISVDAASLGGGANYLTVTGNTVSWASGDDGIRIAGVSGGLIVSGNNVTGSADGIVCDVSSESASPELWVFSANSITCSKSGIHIVSGSNTVSTVSITGNCIDIGTGAGTGDHVIKIDGNYTGMSISGNVLSRSDDDDDNVRFDNSGDTVQDVSISGNIFINGDNGIGGDDVIAQGIHDGNVFTGLAALSDEAVLGFTDGDST